MDGSDVIILKTMVQTKQALRLSMAVSSSLLFYDMAITLSDEVSMVWRRSWSGAKITFFLSRYASLVLCALYTSFLFFGDDSLENPLRFSPSGVANKVSLAGKLSFTIQAWAGWLSVALVQLLLLCWVTAVYGLGRRVFSTVIVAYISLLCSSTTGMIVYMPQMLDNVATPICLPTNTLDEAIFAVQVWKERLPSLWENMLITALPSVLFQLFLLVALVVRSLKFFNATRHLFCRTGVNIQTLHLEGNGYSTGRKQVGPDSEKARNSIGGTLLVCSIVYFTASLAVYCQNFLIWQFAPPQFFSLGIGFSIAIPSLFGARLLLDLRNADKRQTNHRTTIRSMTRAVRSTPGRCGAMRVVSNAFGESNAFGKEETACVSTLSLVILGVGGDVLDEGLDADITPEDDVSVAEHRSSSNIGDSDDFEEGCAFGVSS